MDTLLEPPELTPRVAPHAATALNNGILELISVDSDFDVIEELRRVDPGQ